MRTKTRAIASLMLVTTAIVIGGSSSAQARTLAAPSPKPSTCTYAGARLAAIKAAGPKVRAQSHHRQRVRYDAGLQALSGSTWVAVKHTGKHTIVRVGARNKAMPALNLPVPATSHAGAYRVATKIRWYRGKHVVKTQRIVLRRYSTGADSCLATKPSGSTTPPAPGSQALAVAVTTSPGGTVNRGTPIGGTFTVTGFKGTNDSEMVTATLYADPDSASGCSSTSTMPVGLSSTQVNVTGDGTYSIRAYAPATAGYWDGYFYWGVSTPGNAGTNGASACASVPVKVVSPITVSVVTANTDASLNRTLSKGDITEAVTLDGFGRDTPSYVTATLWGPYSSTAEANNADNANCTGGLHRTATLSNGAPATTPNTNTTFRATTKTTFLLAEKPASLNGGQPAFWRVSANFPGTEWEITPGKVCGDVFHTQN